MMGLTKKTTILLNPDLHERLTRLAEIQGTSIGDLIRTACERVYGLAGSEERQRAVAGLARLSLPVASPAIMERESVPPPDELMP